MQRMVARSNGGRMRRASRAARRGAISAVAFGGASCSSLVRRSRWIGSERGSAAPSSLAASQVRGTRHAAAPQISIRGADRLRAGERPDRADAARTAVRVHEPGLRKPPPLAPPSGKIAGRFRPIADPERRPRRHHGPTNAGPSQSDAAGQDNQPGSRHEAKASAMISQPAGPKARVAADRGRCDPRFISRSNRRLARTCRGADRPPKRKRSAGRHAYHRGAPRAADDSPASANVPSRDDLRAAHGGVPHYPARATRRLDARL
jgi:hypothetical protein